MTLYIKNQKLTMKIAVKLAEIAGPRASFLSEEPLFFTLK